MKKLAIIIFFILAMLNMQAQDYLISFAGTGGSTTVDSVQVKNLTQNTSLTVNGTDVLHLMGVVGIDQPIAQSNADLRIYPNPANEYSFIEFEATYSGIATIEVFDITGKQFTQTQNMLSCGMHTFTLSGLRSGIYTLRIKSALYGYSGKIVSTSIGPDNPKVSYLSGKLKSTTQGQLKSVQSLIPMQYNDGDQLLFKCLSGIFSTVIPLVLTQSQPVTANFVDCTDSDGNHYAVVTIGTQTWMAENLKVGLRIDGVQEQTNNGTIEKYCYFNDVNNCNIYGGLYQWNEMMQYVTTAGVQGICPTGWHLPTDAEWCTVTQFLDPSVNCDIYGYSGIDAGGKMKSTGTVEVSTGLWSSPNTGATNESGFTAVPAGDRRTNGTFDYVGIGGSLWSSSENSTSYYAWLRNLNYHRSDVFRDHFSKEYGFSVRCLRD